MSSRSPIFVKIGERYINIKSIQYIDQGCMLYQYRMENTWLLTWPTNLWRPNECAKVKQFLDSYTIDLNSIPEKDNDKH